MESRSVYVPRMIPESGVALLQKAGLTVKMTPMAGPHNDALMQEAGRHDAVICQLLDAIDRPFLKAAAPRCKVVANCAVGVDNIDLAAAREFNITVTNTPDVLTEATADLTWALLLSTARRTGEAERGVRAGAWRGWGMLDFLGYDVYRRTLGIIGAGRIGTAVARRARGFEMNVLYHSRQRAARIEELGAKRASLYELLEQSDFVSIHTPLTDETHQLIDAKAFARMKRGAILINTARGAVIDQVELIRSLQSGRLAAAGLDVYDKEPAMPPELLEMDNVVLLPHIGSATITTRNRMAELAAENVIAVLNGKKPQTPVT